MVLNSFSYAGGVKKDGGESSKFLLFFVYEGKEVIYFDALKRGIVVSSEVEEGGVAGEYSLLTTASVVKVFTSHEGFGIPKRYHSFYFKFDSAGLDTTILPLSKKQRKIGPFETSYQFFKSRGYFISDKAELKGILDEDSPSYAFFSRQPALLSTLLREILVVEKGSMKPGASSRVAGRRIRF